MAMKCVISIMPRVIEARNVGLYYIEKPFRLIVAGGSGAGKTNFVQRLVNEQHFSSPFDNVRYYCPEYMDGDVIEFKKNVQHYTGMPCMSELTQIEHNTLVILDDLMHECSRSIQMEKLFSVVARKRNISLILVVQNIYHRGLRNIRINATGIVLFKFYAAMDVNKRVIKDLGLKRLITNEQLDTIYSTRYGYIYIHIHPNSHYDFGTLRANIFDYFLSIYYQMEYIAIPKSDFIKYFKIIDAKDGKIKAIKNEVAIKPKRKKQSSQKNNKRAKYSGDSNSNSESATEESDE